MTLGESILRNSSAQSVSFVTSTSRESPCRFCFDLGGGWANVGLMSLHRQSRAVKDPQYQYMINSASKKLKFFGCGANSSALFSTDTWRRILKSALPNTEETHMIMSGIGVVSSLPLDFKAVRNLSVVGYKATPRVLPLSPVVVWIPRDGGPRVPVLLYSTQRPLLFKMTTEIV